MKPSIRKKAIELSEKGDAKALYTLIKADIDLGDPFALHLFSTFSLLEFGESDEEFAKRSISLKIQASEQGVAEASYRMGVNFLYGDDVPQDYKEASKYFERAAIQGHTHAKYTFGFSLYYGTDQNPVDRARGMTLLQEACEEGSVQAKNALREIERER